MSDRGTLGPAHFRVLSLDGGGIRGVITACWLRALQTLLGSPIADHFDLLAGTSTGSILACALALRKDPDEIVSLYRERGMNIFPGLAGRTWSRIGRLISDGPSAPKYDGKGLENELKAAFGERVFGELLPQTMVVSYETTLREARVFKSTSRQYGYENCLVWEIVKGSCSAPTYFPAHALKIRDAIYSMVDGGVAANNPSACAIAESVKQDSKRPEKERVGLERLIVASFGTGALTRPITLESAQEWGALEWALPVIDVLMDGSADVTDYLATQLLKKENYFRLQTTLDLAYDDMDNASPVNVNALITTAERYLREEGQDKLVRLVARLRRTGRVAAPPAAGAPVG